MSTEREVLKFSDPFEIGRLKSLANKVELYSIREVKMFVGLYDIATLDRAIAEIDRLNEHVRSLQSMAANSSSDTDVTSA